MTRTAATSKAAVDGVIVGCLYLPNGNPQPGPKFDYKLKWFERLNRACSRRCSIPVKPVVLAGDYNVVPTDVDIYNPKSWRKDALLQPETREAYRRLLAQGWTDAIRERVIPRKRIYTFWDYFRNHWAAQRGPAHRSSAAQPGTGSPPRRCERRSVGARADRARAIMRRRG